MYQTIPLKNGGPISFPDGAVVLLVSVPAYSKEVELENLSRLYFEITMLPHLKRKPLLLTFPRSSATMKNEISTVSQLKPH